MRVAFDGRLDGWGGEMEERNFGEGRGLGERNVVGEGAVVEKRGAQDRRLFGRGDDQNLAR